MSKHSLLTFRNTAIFLGIIVLLFSIFLSIQHWESRPICLPQSEIDKLESDAINNKSTGFFQDSAQKKFDDAKSCFQPDEDNSALGENIINSSLLIASYLALVGAASLATRLANRDKRNHKQSYNKLEALALWRFCKVLFWLSAIVVITYLALHKNYDNEHNLIWLAVLLAISSYPLFIILKRLAIYIVNGKK
jgi:hypothetical protein